MGETTKIEWASATFNPWWGCTKVSAACDNCYAETLATRFGTNWGKDAPRKFFGDKHWAEPLKWNRKAGETGERPRVFCASMADVFEDNASLTAERERLWRLIEATPNLIWLLLTKRPHLMTRFAPAHWVGGWPENVWAMTTAEDQTWANARIPWLMRVPAVVRGLSMEPLFDAVTLPADFLALGSAGWIITGGESGPDARPGLPEWYQTLRDQATGAGVPFLFKQWGNWLPLSQTQGWVDRSFYSDAQRGHALHLLDGTVLRGVWPQQILHEDVQVNDLAFNVGKRAAGRLLDGRTWDELPALL